MIADCFYLVMDISGGLGTTFVVGTYLIGVIEFKSWKWLWED